MATEVTKENLICVFFIVIGGVGAHALLLYLPFSIQKHINVQIILSFPFVVVGLLVYGLINKWKKAVISGVLATVLSFIILIYLGIGVLMPY